MCKLCEQMDGKRVDIMEVRLELNGKKWVDTFVFGTEDSVDLPTPYCPKCGKKIKNVRTAATKVRELKVTVKFEPSSDRQNVTVKVVTQSKLQPYDATQTALFVGKDDDGQLGAVELTKHISGQIDLDGCVVEPTKLKIAR